MAENRDNAFRGLQTLEGRLLLSSSVNLSSVGVFNTSDPFDFEYTTVLQNSYNLFAAHELLPGDLRQQTVALADAGRRFSVVLDSDQAGWATVTLDPGWGQPQETNLQPAARMGSFPFVRESGDLGYQSLSNSSYDLTPIEGESVYADYLAWVEAEQNRSGGSSGIVLNDPDVVVSESDAQIFNTDPRLDDWAPTSWRVWLPGGQPVRMDLALVEVDGDAGTAYRFDTMLDSGAAKIQALVPEDRNWYSASVWGSDWSLLEERISQVIQGESNILPNTDQPLSQASFVLSMTLDQPASPRLSFGAVPDYHNGGKVFTIRQYEGGERVWSSSDDLAKRFGRPVPLAQASPGRGYELQLPTIWESEERFIQIPIVNTGAEVLTFVAVVNDGGAFKIVGRTSGNVAPGQTVHLNLAPAQYVLDTSSEPRDSIGAVYGASTILLTTNDPDQAQTTIEVHGSLSEEPIGLADIPSDTFDLAAGDTGDLLAQARFNAVWDQDSYFFERQRPGYSRVVFTTFDVLSDFEAAAILQAVTDNKSKPVMTLTDGTRLVDYKLKLTVRNKLMVTAFIPVSSYSKAKALTVDASSLPGLAGHRYKVVVKDAESAVLSVFGPGAAEWIYDLDDTANDVGTIVFDKRPKNFARGWVQSVEISNHGTEKLVIRGGKEKKRFEFAHKKKVTIKPGQSKQIKFRFKGGKVGKHEGAVSVLTNDPGRREITFVTEMRVTKARPTLPQKDDRIKINDAIVFVGPPLNLNNPEREYPPICACSVGFVEVVSRLEPLHSYRDVSAPSDELGLVNK